MLLPDYMQEEQMLKVFYPIKEVPAAAAGKKKNTKEVDIGRTKCLLRSLRNMLTVMVVNTRIIKDRTA